MRKLFKLNKKGQGMVEYGLIIALIAVVCIAALTLVGGNAKTTFNNIAGELGKAVPGV